MRSPFIAISLFAANLVTAAPSSPKLGADTFIPKGTDMDMNRVAGLPRDLLRNMESGGAGLPSYASKSSSGSVPAPGSDLFTAASQAPVDPITAAENVVQTTDNNSSASKNNDNALEATTEGREPDHHTHDAPNNPKAAKDPITPTFSEPTSRTGRTGDPSRAFTTGEGASVAPGPGAFASAEGDQTTGEADKTANQAAGTAGGTADGTVPSGTGNVAANTAKSATDGTTGTTKSTTDKAADTADKTASEASNGANSEATNKGAGSTSNNGAGSKTNGSSGSKTKPAKV